MSDRDILSNFFNEFFSNRKNNNKCKSSYSKKNNYLRRYNIFCTENNILKFTPNDICKTDRKTISIFNKLYANKPFKNKELIKKIYKNKLKNNTSLDNKNHNNKSLLLKSIKHKNLDIFPINNSNSQNRTSYTYFNSINTHVKPKIESIKDKSIIYNRLKKRNKIKNQIDEKANKLVNYYMNTDLSNIKNNSLEKKKLNKIKIIENKIKQKRLIDQKLLKIKNIKHQLILGDCSNFKTINIQIKALGNKKSRKNTLAGIKDYYSNETYIPIKDYIIDNKGKNKDNMDDEMLNELRFDEHKVNFALTERIKRKNILENRVNKKLISLSFNKVRSKVNKTEYLNFYQKMDCLYDKVKKTYGHIGKRIEKRQTFKDNINGLFLI